MSKDKIDIKLQIKVKNLRAVFNLLQNLTDVNTSAFTSRAKILIYRLQKELFELQNSNLTDEEYNEIKDVEIDFGYKLPPPVNYPIEYRSLLESICVNLPKQTTTVSKIIAELKK